MVRHGTGRGRQSIPFLFGVESFPICLLPHDGVANKVVGVSHGAARVCNEGMTKQFFDEGRRAVACRFELHDGGKKLVWHDGVATRLQRLAGSGRNF